MEEAFEKMKKEGKNDVDNLVKWMKDSKILTDKTTEEKAKELFKDAKNKKNVEIEKFKSVLAKIAKDQNKSLEEVSNTLLSTLADKGKKFAGALDAAGAAFKDAMNK